MSEILAVTGNDGYYAAPHTIHDGIYFEGANGVASCNIAKGTESVSW